MLWQIVKCVGTIHMNCHFSPRQNFWQKFTIFSTKTTFFKSLQLRLHNQHNYHRHSCLAPPGRGGRYIDEKLSKADKSAFLKLSATYRYRKMEILKLSKNYRYRKMHQIWSDKYMKSQSIRYLISAIFFPKNAIKITPSCLVTMKSSTDILAQTHLNS